jgi:hypothetical protein
MRDTTHAVNPHSDVIIADDRKLAAELICGLLDFENQILFTCCALAYYLPYFAPAPLFRQLFTSDKS